MESIVADSRRARYPVLARNSDYYALVRTLEMDRLANPFRWH